MNRFWSINALMPPTTKMETASIKKRAIATSCICVGLFAIVVLTTRGGVRSDDLSSSQVGSHAITTTSRNLAGSSKVYYQYSGDDPCVDDKYEKRALNQAKVNEDESVGNHHLRRGLELTRRRLVRNTELSVKQNHVRGGGSRELLLSKSECNCNEPTTEECKCECYCKQQNYRALGSSSNENGSDTNWDTFWNWDEEKVNTFWVTNVIEDTQEKEAGNIVYEHQEDVAGLEQLSNDGINMEIAEEEGAGGLNEDEHQEDDTGLNCKCVDYDSISGHDSIGNYQEDTRYSRSTKCTKNSDSSKRSRSSSSSDTTTSSTTSSTSSSTSTTSSTTSASTTTSTSVTSTTSSTTTSQPTSEPSSTPSAEPTSNPTSNPTSDPTSQPTSEPSSTPSAEPTSNPTSNPTSDPTSQPTAAPETTTTSSTSSTSTTSETSTTSTTSSTSTTSETSTTSTTSSTSTTSGNSEQFPTPPTAVPATAEPTTAEPTPTAPPNRPSVPTDVCTDGEDFCFCGRCVDSCSGLSDCVNFCEPDNGNDIEPPKVLYLKPLNGCTKLFVDFEKESNDCEGEFDLISGGTFADGTFAIRKSAAGGSCNGNDKLNPNIWFRCIETAVEASTTDIHTSCSFDISLCSVFGKYQVVGYENGDGTIGFGSCPAVTTVSATPATQASAPVTPGGELATTTTAASTAICQVGGEQCNG